MTKLNRSLPFGTIAGVYEYLPTAQYTQGGNFFDAHGELINEKSNEGQRQDDGPEIQANEHGIDGRNGHDDADGKADAQTGSATTNDDEGQNEEGHVLDTPSENGSLVMDKTDEELKALADSGMTPLRQYAAPFGIKGVSKQEIIDELKALR